MVQNPSREADFCPAGSPWSDMPFRSIINLRNTWNTFNTWRFVAYTQGPATGFYHEPLESDAHGLALLFWDPF
jgi:hypothetical protein